MDSQLNKTSSPRRAAATAAGAIKTTRRPLRKRIALWRLWRLILDRRPQSRTYFHVVGPFILAVGVAWTSWLLATTAIALVARESIAASLGIAIGVALFGSLVFGGLLYRMVGKGVSQRPSETWRSDLESLDLTTANIGPYYLPYRSAAANRSADGLIALLTPHGLMQTPVHVAQYALSEWTRFQDTGNQSHESEFLAHASWLVKNQKLEEPNVGAWLSPQRSDYYWPHETPFRSAMAQGQAMSVLTRAYSLTGDERFARAALAGLVQFEQPADVNGVRTRGPAGEVYYEEWCVPPFHSRTLNGMIFALFGLFDVHRVLGDPKAKELFDAGIATLARPDVLDLYDLGFTSSYDQLPFRLAPPRYNDIHYQQLYALYCITGMTVFREYADRWEGYARSWRSRTRLAITIFSQRLALLVIRRK